MTRKPLVNIPASVRARLLKVAKERREDFTLMLMNYAAERFLYRLSKSKRRDQFVLKGAMLFAVRIGEPYRPTRGIVRRGQEAGASNYLADPTLSIAEVTYLLGYSEPTAFYRAFKRWHRMTPYAFRARAASINRFE